MSSSIHHTNIDIFQVVYIACKYFGHLARLPTSHIPPRIHSFPARTSRFSYNNLTHIHIRYSISCCCCALPMTFESSSYTPISIHSSQNLTFTMRDLIMVTITYRMSGPFRLGPSIRRCRSNNEWELWPTVQVRGQKGSRHDQRLSSDLFRRNSQLKIKCSNKGK
jgi:hypothetical protein